jgi:hypothetical protein
MSASVDVYIGANCAGRRALVVLPNDPDLVDILAKNGVDISVSEGEQQVLASAQSTCLHVTFMPFWIRLLTVEVRPAWLFSNQ